MGWVKLKETELLELVFPICGCPCELYFRVGRVAGEDAIGNLCGLGHIEAHIAGAVEHLHLARRVALPHNITPSAPRKYAYGMAGTRLS